AWRLDPTRANNACLGTRCRARRGARVVPGVRRTADSSAFRPNAAPGIRAPSARLRARRTRDGDASLLATPKPGCTTYGSVRDHACVRTQHVERRSAERPEHVHDER